MSILTVYFYAEMFIHIVLWTLCDFEVYKCLQIVWGRFLDTLYFCNKYYWHKCHHCSEVSVERLPSTSPFLCEGSQVFEKALFFTVCPRICHLFITKYAQKCYLSCVSTPNVVKEVKRLLVLYFFVALLIVCLFSFPTKITLHEDRLLWRLKCIF